MGKKVRGHFNHGNEMMGALYGYRAMAILFMQQLCVDGITDDELIQLREILEKQARVVHAKGDTPEDIKNEYIIIDAALRAIEDTFTDPQIFGEPGRPRPEY